MGVFVVILAAVLAALPGCKREAPGGSGSTKADQVSPQARWDMVEFLRQDLAAERHPSDGGGRAWIDPDNSIPSATVRSPGRWTVVYEVGEHGIAESGALFFLVSPFWGWSTPQTSVPEARGYTTVTTDAAGVELETSLFDQAMLVITVQGRALAPGEQVRIVYGAGPEGAIADRFAERESRFWIAVDGDGDGVRKYLADSPFVAVESSPPSRMLLTLPTTARPGDVVRLTIALVDPLGNVGYPIEGDVVFDEVPDGLDLPARVTLSAADKGRRTIGATVREGGVYRIRASGPLGLSAETNPLVVSENEGRVWWGDVHGHSGLSDGTGTVEDYFVYARDVAALDVIALTDHDHWGTLALDRHPEMWAEIRAQTERFHIPGRFVTLLGYEWTSWIHGHRHVLYFEDEGDVLSSILPEYESPTQLWAALRGKKALTFAHHSAGGPIGTNWSIPPDPELEPLTEVVSVHGVSEAADSPLAIYNPIPGNFVRDALDRGYVLGFVGSGDSHDGHPGLSHLASNGTGGLVGILSETLSRDAVLAAFRQRRVYATSGPRVLLRVTLDGNPMGSVVRSAVPTGVEATGEWRAELPRLRRESELSVHIVAPEPVERVDGIRSGEIVESISGEGQRDFSFRGTIRDLKSGEYVYIRVVQADGGLAWSSPFFVE